MEVVVALERESCAFTWVEVLSKADAQFHDLHSHWTPAGGKGDSTTVSKREFSNFVNTCNQKINNLKLQNNGGGGGSGSGKLCQDCGFALLLDPSWW